MVVGSALHPLDPLSREEITASVAVLKAAGKATDASRFPLSRLHEPPKEDVLRLWNGSCNSLLPAV